MSVRDLEKGTQARVKVTSTPLTSPAEVLKRIEPYTEGWICFTDGWEWKSRGERKHSPSSATGFPVSAEVVLDDHRSAQLRQGPGGWLWTEIEETQEGAEAWAFDEEYVSTERQHKLQYRTYWLRSEDPRDSEVRPWRPALARFIGWKKED